MIAQKAKCYNDNRLKCTKLFVDWGGSAPHLPGGSLQRSPRPLSSILKGLLLRKRR